MGTTQKNMQQKQIFKLANAVNELFIDAGNNTPEGVLNILLEDYDTSSYMNHSKEKILPKDDVGIPKQIKEQALEAERLIDFERRVIARADIYLSQSLEKIKPLLDGVEESKRSVELSFGTALKLMKYGIHMTNDRLQEENKLHAIALIDGKFFLVKVHNENLEHVKLKRWTHIDEDLIQEDWSVFSFKQYENTPPWDHRNDDDDYYYRHHERE